MKPAHLVAMIVFGVSCLLLGYLLRPRNEAADSLNAKLYIAEARVIALDSAYRAEVATNDVLIREIGLRKNDIRKLKQNSHENLIRIDTATTGYLIGFFSGIDTSRFLE